MKKRGMKPAPRTDQFGGYSFDFVRDPPNLVVCVICHLPSKDPCLSECCGHIFCRSCLQQCKSTPHTLRVCPMCGDGRFKTVSNKQIDREVRSLYVYCTNKGIGCTWQGEINNITSHLEKSDGCQYEEVKCTFNCKKLMQRRHLTNHMKDKCPCRRVACKYCNDTGEHQFIEDKHKDKCHKFPLNCPNKCEVGIIPREDMEAHRKVCSLEMIWCEYRSVGCEAKMARKKRKSHEEENMEEHLRMTKLKLAKTEDKLLSTEERVSNVETMLNCLIQNSTGTGMVITETNWASHLAALAKNALKTCPVVIRLLQFISNVESGDRWYSDPFYTIKNGYQMCLSANMHNDSDYLSVWLYLMKGPNDDELTWPLRIKFELKLLNQISDSEHYLKMLTFDERVDDDVSARVIDDKLAKGWGYSKFISFKNLFDNTETCQYLKDDCIFFQVRTC